MQVAFYANLTLAVMLTKFYIIMIIGCDPQQLNEGKMSVANTHKCGGPLRSLGIPNGIVCYTGIDVGATAIYSCFNCDTATKIMSVRTCLPNGTWNGTIPQCEGDAKKLYIHVMLITVHSVQVLL